MASVNFDSSVGGDGSTVSDDASPTTGLANYGWKTRFVPALANIVSIALWVKNKALEVLGFALSATNAPNTQATSTTSLAIGTGAKSLTVQAGKSFLQGHYIVLASQGTASQSMLGQVTSYNSSTGALVVNVTNTIGAGTYADWVAYTAGHQLEFAVLKDAAGNVGGGVTPSPSSLPTFESQYGIFMGRQGATVSHNAYSDGGWKYSTTNFASRYLQQNGAHSWFIAPSGTAGNPITFTQAMTLDASGNLLLTSGTGALGYGTGAGGTVTQPTSKATAVPLNKSCGQITTASDALAAGASVEFTLNNSKITTSTMCDVNPVNNSSYDVTCSAIVSGYAVIKIKNNTGASRSEALVISFKVTPIATS